MNQHRRRLFIISTGAVSGGTRGEWGAGVCLTKQLGSLGSIVSYPSMVQEPRQQMHSGEFLAAEMFLC